jgi:mRNA interferase MazF
MSPSLTPHRGELWWFDPDPVQGHELGKKVRTGLVVSVEDLNEGDDGLVIVVPCTTTSHDIPSHIPMNLVQRGRRVTSYICCEHVRSISTTRLQGRMMAVPIQPQIMNQVEHWLRELLGL